MLLPIVISFTWFNMLNFTALIPGVLEKSAFVSDATNIVQNNKEDPEVL